MIYWWLGLVVVTFLAGYFSGIYVSRVIRFRRKMRELELMTDDLNRTADIYERIAERADVFIQEEKGKNND